MNEERIIIRFYNTPFYIKGDDNALMVHIIHET